MPQYFYVAKSMQGETKNGFLEAKDQHDLARILHQEGYVLISADIEEKEEKPKIGMVFFRKSRGVPLKEKIFFTRNLQVMISAGISLPRAIRILTRQTKNNVFKKALLDINEKITKGTSFSESLAEYPNIFPELYQNMVKVGEETGTLDEVLNKLTVQMEKQSELVSKVKGAMMYPAVIITAMLIIGYLMIVMVVPKLAETFQELNVELPITTKIVIAFGKFLSEKWYLVLFIISGSVFGILEAPKTRIGKRIFDTAVLKIPIISSIVKKTNSASTVRTLSSLLGAGMPIVRALEIVSGTLGNIHYKKAVSEAAEKVEKGGKLSESLAPYQDIYPSIVIQMIEVGEETGETTTILSKLADFFEEEVTTTTKNLSSIIEPILMIIVGVAVGFFAVSMFQPMYSMLGNI
jgi:type IV pilus assembly protein PilC